MKRKTISTILIITGILIMCIPLAGRWYTDYRQEKAYEAYLDQMGKQMSAMSETFEDTDAATAGAIAEPAGTTGTQQPAKSSKSIEGVIGRIRIPAISCNLLLLEGSSTTQLRWGAGHVTGTAMPGEAGNCAVAAHRNYTFGTYFSRLGEVVLGNEILVEYKGTTYTYKVTEIFTIKPDEVWVLGTDGTPIITLITCHPKGNNTQRLIVRGTLVQDQIQQQENPVEHQTASPEASSGSAVSEGGVEQP